MQRLQPGALDAHGIPQRRRPREGAAMKVEAVVEQGDTALGVAGPGVGRHQGGGRRRVLVPAPRRLRQGEQRTFQRIGEEAEGKLARTRSGDNTSELQSLMRTAYAVFCLKKEKK